MNNKLPKKFWKKGKSKFVAERAKQEGLEFIGYLSYGVLRALLDKKLQKQLQK